MKAQYSDPLYIITWVKFSFKPNTSMSTQRKNFTIFLHIRLVQNPSNKIGNKLFIFYVYTMYIMVDWNTFIQIYCV